MPAALQLERLGFSFDGRRILDGFSLTVEQGEKVVLTAPSGTGKSLLLHSLLGFAKPSEGKIFIEGKTLQPSTVWSLRRSIALLAQEPELGRGRLSEALTHPFSYHANAGLPHGRDDFLRLFERFGLRPECWDRDLPTLSGGEKQRAALCLAILLKRPIMLLDEPVSALDRDSADSVRDWFCTEYDGTVLAAVHHAERFDLGGRTVSLEQRGDA